MITLGRAFGIPIRVDRSWFIVFALVACSLALVYFPRALPTAPAAAHWAWGVGAAVLLFASLLAHELAHARTAHHYGIRVESITLHLLGGVSEMAEEPPTPRAELLIAVAGPVTSVALAGLAFGARALVEGPAWTLVLFGYVGAANLVVAVFNLLPGYPLDGGRILRATLWACRGSFGWATRVASRIGRMSGLALAGFGAGNAAATGEVVGGLWLVMVGIFVYQSARDAGRLGEIRERLAPLEVEQIMGAPPAATTVGDGQNLGPHDSAWLAFRHLAGTGTRVVRVVEDGRVVGAVDRERLKESLTRRDGEEHVA